MQASAANIHPSKPNSSVTANPRLAQSIRRAGRGSKRELWLRRYRRAAGKTVRVLDRNDSHRFWNGAALRLLADSLCKAEANSGVLFATRHGNGLAEASESVPQAAGCICRRNPAPLRRRKK